MPCVCQGVCACMHTCVCVRQTLLSVSTSQQTKQQCQPGDSTAGWRLGPGMALRPIPFTCSCRGNPFPLCSSSLGSLQSGMPRGRWAAALSPPASVASSLLQELGQILLSCPCAPSQQSDAGMSRREGRRGKQGVIRASRKGSDASSLQVLPQRLGSLSFHPSLVPACVSVTSGNFRWVCLCRGWPHPSLGPHCTPARAAVAAAGETLTTSQAAKEGPLGSEAPGLLQQPR